MAVWLIVGLDLPVAVTWTRLAVGGGSFFAQALNPPTSRLAIPTSMSLIL
jgi:hypothetical protein